MQVGWLPTRSTRCLPSLGKWIPTMASATAPNEYIRRSSRFDTDVDRASPSLPGWMVSTNCTSTIRTSRGGSNFAACCRANSVFLSINVWRLDSIFSFGSRSCMGISKFIAPLPAPSVTQSLALCRLKFAAAPVSRTKTRIRLSMSEKWMGYDCRTPATVFVHTSIR